MNPLSRSQHDLMRLSPDAAAGRPVRRPDLVERLPQVEPTKAPFDSVPLKTRNPNMRRSGDENITVVRGGSLSRGGPYGFGVGELILRDTYYVSSGASRSQSLQGGATRTSLQTAAGTHDGSAATKDGVTHTNSGMGDPFVSGMAVDWSAFTRAGSYAGTILFARFIFKVGVTGASGANNYLVVARSENANRGGALDVSQSGAAEVYVDFSVDSTGVVWTHTTLTTIPFGYFLYTEGSDDSDGDSPTIDCEEFRVEVWGTG